MAFKMKGSTHYGKNPLKQKQSVGQMTAVSTLDAENKKAKEIQERFNKTLEQDLIKYQPPKLIPLPKTQVEKQRLRKEKMLKKSPAKFDDTVKGKSKKVAKHPLYDKLPSWAKTAYNKLNEQERANVNKNKSESQLLNSLGDYTPKFEGGDQIWHLNRKHLCFLKLV